MNQLRILHLASRNKEASEVVQPSLDNSEDLKILNDEV